MRRIALYFGIAVALVASCSVKEKDFNVPQPEDVRFHASFEQLDTKVFVNEDLLLRWTADDRISIFNKQTAGQEYKFIGQTGDDSGDFQKVGEGSATGSALANVIAVYPCQAGTTVSESGVISLAFPAEQAYAQNSFGLGANPMVSVSADENLQFKNVGGYLKVSLFGSGYSVSSITLKGNNGEKIAGNATVTMPLDGVPTVEMADDAGTEITLTCAEPVSLGVSAAESVDFWFVVPPVTFSKGFTVSFKHQEGVTTRSTDKSVTITRNYLSKMSVSTTLTGARPGTYRISHLWLWGGTGSEYSGTRVIDLFTVPEYFNKDDNRGVTALMDNFYQIGADGSFTNYAGEDGRNWWFVYSGSVNPETHKDLDLRKFYDVLPLSTGSVSIDGTTVKFTRADGTSTQATWVGPGTYEMLNTNPLKTVKIENQALMFTISGGKDNWGENMYTDYQAIAGRPRVLFVELEQLPVDFVVPEASRTTDADFKYEEEFDLTTLPGKWNVYGNNGKPYGIWVLGGSCGDPGFVSPLEKTWCWDDSIYRESDNGLVIKVTSFSAASAEGTINWWSGADGKFWDYIWKGTSVPEYTDKNLSEFYDQIPKGEHAFSFDLATMKVTLGNGHVATFLTPGTYSFPNNKTLEIPAGCFALDFHLKDNPVLPATSFRYKDIDRFMFAPIEYFIIFEKQ